MAKDSPKSGIGGDFREWQLLPELLLTTDVRSLVDRAVGQFSRRSTAYVRLGHADVRVFLLLAQS